MNGEVALAAPESRESFIKDEGVISDSRTVKWDEIKELKLLYFGNNLVLVRYRSNEAAGRVPVGNILVPDISCVLPRVPGERIRTVRWTMWNSLVAPLLIFLPSMTLLAILLHRWAAFAAPVAYYLFFGRRWQEFDDRKEYARTLLLGVGGTFLFSLIMFLMLS